MEPTPRCPVLEDAARAAELGADLALCLRRLRLSTQACPTCPQAQGCPWLDYYRAQVSAAVSQINEEWGMC